MKYWLILPTILLFSFGTTENKTTKTVNDAGPVTAMISGTTGSKALDGGIIQLRLVGRFGKHCQPNGIAWYKRRDPDYTGNL
jgi:hypothetical protein